MFAVADDETIEVQDQVQDTDGQDDQEQIPELLPLLPLRNDVVFPHMVVPLVVGRDKGIRLVDQVLVGDKMLGLVTQHKPDIEDPTPDDLYTDLTAARVLKMLKFPDGSTRIIAQGLARARIKEIDKTNPYIVAKVKLFEDVVETGVEMDALIHNVKAEFRSIADKSSQVPEDLQVAVMNTDAPGRLADLAILSGNPLEAAPARLKDIRALATIIGGRVVWEN